MHVPESGGFAVGVGGRLIGERYAAGVGIDLGRLDRPNVQFPFFELAVAFIDVAERFAF